MEGGGGGRWGKQGSGGCHDPAGGLDRGGKSSVCHAKATWGMVGVISRDLHEVIGRSTTPRLVTRENWPGQLHLSVGMDGSAVNAWWEGMDFKFRPSTKVWCWANAVTQEVKIRNSR